MRWHAIIGNVTHAGQLSQLFGVTDLLVLTLRFILENIGIALLIANGQLLLKILNIKVLLKVIFELRASETLDGRVDQVIELKWLRVCHLQFSKFYFLL